MATPPASNKTKTLFSVDSGGVKLRRAPWCALGFRPPRRPPSGWFYVPVPVDVAAASGSIGTAANSDGITWSPAEKTAGLKRPPG